MTAAKAIKAINQLANPDRARQSQYFFKTGKGDYAAGDKFIGVSMPVLRKLANEFKCLEIKQLEILLHSKIHEQRMLALLILMLQFNQAKKLCDTKRQTALFNYYLTQTQYINNWDLVDVSCRDIVGGYLLDKSKQQKKCLLDLARSADLWERRIAIVSTWQFIRQRQFDETLQISRILLRDSHDLIHKAVGWMLREMGKRDQSLLLAFLDQFAAKMPRTMLRYAIEKFDENLRQHYLKGLNTNP